MKKKEKKQKGQEKREEKLTALLEGSGVNNNFSSLFCF